MTITGTENQQKRLESCDLKVPKRAKIGEKPGDNACDALKKAVFAGDANGRLENTSENRQYPPNTKLLGKYRLI